MMFVISGLVRTAIPPSLTPGEGSSTEVKIVSVAWSGFTMGRQLRGALFASQTLMDRPSADRIAD